MRRDKPWFIAYSLGVALVGAGLLWAIHDPEPDPLTPADLAAAILAADAERAQRQTTPPAWLYAETPTGARFFSTRLLADAGWQWLRCEDGASVWLDSGGAEVRLDGCAP